MPNQFEKIPTLNLEKNQEEGELFETLPQKELKEQYEGQKEILERVGILEQFANGEMGIKGIDNKEYSFPSYAEIVHRMRENKEVLGTKIEQGFNQLLISPLGMKLDDLIEKYRQVILKHYKEGKLLATKENPSDSEKYLKLNENNPVWTLSEYLNADVNGRMVYYPEKFSEKQGKTKQEVLSVHGAWNILLLEDLPNIPKEKKGKEIKGRKQLETGKTPNQYLEMLKKDSHYQNEIGMTLEDQITYAIKYLEQTSQVIDDCNGNGSVSYQLGAYFPTDDGGLIPDFCLHSGNQRVRMDGDGPEDFGSGHGARSAVRVYLPDKSQTPSPEEKPDKVGQESKSESEKLFSVEAEKVFDFEEWGLKGEWLKISAQDGKSVEGAYYKSESENDNGEVVIFHPGLPGDAVVKFEEDFVQKLIDQGYDVFVARHNGLKNQEDNEKFFHNKKRTDQEKNISGEPTTWFNEPEVSTTYFAQKDKPINLITHSFSGVTAANSFVEMTKDGIDKSPAQKVKKWILASGSVWELGDDGVLDLGRNFSVEGMRKYCQYLSEKYVMSSEYGAEELVDKIKETLKKITAEIGDSLPKKMEVIGVYPTADKLVSPETGISFVDKLPRGIILRDNHIPAENEDPHDFTHARAEDLIRIIEMKTSKQKHTFHINKNNLKE